MFFQVRSEKTVPPGTVGWWGFTEDKYPDGSAFINEKAQRGDMKMVVVYKVPEGFVPSGRFRRRKRALSGH
jgi:hypothetical protein